VHHSQYEFENYFSLFTVILGISKNVDYLELQNDSAIATMCKRLVVFQHFPLFYHLIWPCYCFLRLFHLIRFWFFLIPCSFLFFLVFPLSFFSVCFLVKSFSSCGYWTSSSSSLVFLGYYILPLGLPLISCWYWGLPFIYIFFLKVMLDSTKRWILKQNNQKQRLIFGQIDQETQLGILTCGKILLFGNKLG